jgi:GDPmannose 4,6-dehydratase
VSWAAVFGSAGQDGHYLSAQLRARGYQVVGVDLGGVTTSAPLPLPSTLDVLDASATARFLGQVPELERVFYLAAFHHSSEEAHDTDLGMAFKQSFSVHVDGWLNVLEALSRGARGCRAFYPASSHVFGDPPETPQSERTPIRPTNVYGISKSAGLEIARYYRARGQHVSAGFLYNHESELRHTKFVSQRVAAGAAAAQVARQRGQPYKLELGALSAIVDWGYAPDYTRAMQVITDHEQPDDYVVATGVPHTVADLCEAAFAAVELDWREYVVERPGRITKQLSPLVGDARKLRALGWAPSISFELMIERMVRTQVAALPR